MRPPELASTVMCIPPPKWEGPPEDGLLRTVSYHRQPFGWLKAEARDPEYVAACVPDLERFRG